MKELYVLTMGNKYYSDEEKNFVTDLSKATLYDTFSAASKKRNKLYKKIFGNIGIKAVNSDEIKTKDKN